MAKKTVMQIVQENEDKIPTRYDLNLSEIQEIYHTAQDGVWSMICNAFVFGYGKDQQAEKARRAAKA